jgi:YggT family protein
MITMIITKLIDLYTIVIVVYVLMSWIPQMNGWVADLYSILEKICEPYLNVFRKLIPPVGSIDFSPIVAVIALQVIIMLIRILI